MSQNNAAQKTMPVPIITHHNSGIKTELTTAVEKSFQRALQRQGKLIQGILEMPGMSGQIYRYFINNLIEELDDARYLEVGSWAGSTMCSAIYGNSLRAYAIDNWSEFGDVASPFMRNVGAWVNKEIQFNLLTSDFRKVNYNHLGGKFNVYMFDGPHEEEDQYDGVTIAMPAVDDEFVLIVDDYNWHRVRVGTERALRDLNLDVLCAFQVLTTTDNTSPELIMQESEWHNGYLIAVLRKKSAGA